MSSINKYMMAVLMALIMTLNVVEVNASFRVSLEKVEITD